MFLSGGGLFHIDTLPKIDAVVPSGPSGQRLRLLPLTST